MPTVPRMPDSITFPVQWRDGSWDNAHWHWRYVLRGTHGETFYESGDQPVAVPGLTRKERQEQAAKKLEWLTPAARPPLNDEGAEHG